MFDYSGFGIESKLYASNLSDTEITRKEITPMIGLGIGYKIDEQVSWFASLMYQDLGTFTASADVYVGSDSVLTTVKDELSMVRFSTGMIYHLQ